MEDSIKTVIDLDLLWHELVSKKIGFSGGPDLEGRRTYGKKLKGEDYLVLSTDEITMLGLDLISLAKIDAKELAVRLKGDEDASVLYAAIAIRSIFETENIYVEIPGACSSFNVPKSFVLLVLAALTGLAAQKASEWGGLAPGISVGISGLLINIISSRYNSTGIPKTDWVEEALLATLQTEGRLSAPDIERRTNFHINLVESTLKKLVSKELVAERVDWVKNEKIYYEIRN